MKTLLVLVALFAGMNCTTEAPTAADCGTTYFAANPAAAAAALTSCSAEGVDFTNGVRY